MPDYNHNPDPRPKPLSDAADDLETELAKWLRSAGITLELTSVMLKDTLSSTQDHLLSQLSTCPEGLVVVSALQQTHARGQFQRRWHTQSGDLALSAAIPIRRDQITQLPKLPLWIAAELASALNQLALGDSRVWLKWPNDLVIEASHSDHPYLKLGGILCQFQPQAKAHQGSSATQTDSDISGHVVMGIGINRGLRSQSAKPAAVSGEAAAKSVDKPTADLGLLGIQLELDQLRLLTLKALIRACDHCGLMANNQRRSLGASLTERYNPNHLLSGHRVTLSDPQSDQLLATGICRGIDTDGALIIHTQSDSIEPERFFSGRLRLADASSNDAF